MMDDAKDLINGISKNRSSKIFTELCNEPRDGCSRFVVISSNISLIIVLFFGATITGIERCLSSNCWRCQMFTIVFSSELDVLLVLYDTP